MTQLDKAILLFCEFQHNPHIVHETEQNQRTIQADNDEEENLHCELLLLFVSISVIL
jgi:hypothetical protein